MADSQYVIYGLHAVTSALKQADNILKKLFVDKRRSDGKIREIISLADQVQLRVERVESEQLHRLTQGAKHQGVVALTRRPEVMDEPYLKALLKKLQQPALLLVLDGIQDPHNLGACLRTADAAGVHAVITPRDRSVSLTAVVCKVACGAAEVVPLIQVTNLSRTLKWLKQNGVWLIGTAGEAQQTLYQADLTGSLALVMGGEGKGLRRLTREQCDLLISIPMQGRVESLNVSVATGVALYEAMRQRKERE